MLKHPPEFANLGESDYLLDHIFADPSHPTGWRYDRSALEDDRIFRTRCIEAAKDLNGRDLLTSMVEGVSAKNPGKRLVLAFHHNADKMKALFPDDPILHLLRDPRDVAYSSIGMGWTGNSYYGVEHWIGTEIGWKDAAISEDRVMTLTFEDLVRDLEPMLQKVCAFLGHDYSPQMLTYHENSTYDPIDPGIAQKWKKKAPPREIALIEGRIGSLLEARGYEPAGEPRFPGALERFQLATQNRLVRWRYNIRRYGLKLFVAHHVARFLGLKGLQHRYAKQQEAILIANLK